MGLTNTQYDSIRRVYDRRQTENHRIEQQRREEVYRKVPVLREIDRARAERAIGRVRQSLAPDRGNEGMPSSSGDSAGLSASDRSRISAAVASGRTAELKKEYLVQAGFPADYLDPVYQCSDCRDTGLVSGRHCHCFNREVIRLFYTQSGLGEVLLKENYDTLRMDYYPEDIISPKTGMTSRLMMEQAVSGCHHFTDAFISDTKVADAQYLMLTGEPGLGKTFLTHCIANDLIGKGFSVIYYSAGELFDKLAKVQFRKDYDPREKPVSEEFLTGCDVLIIDDLGTELTNSFTTSALFRLLNGRIAHSKSMVISTNLSMPELRDLYSERITSRILERFNIYELFGKDIRIQKRIGG